MVTQCKWLVLLVVIVLLSNGCISDEKSGSRTAASPTDARRLWIDPIMTALGVTGRSYLVCPKGKCVILHYPPTEPEAPDLGNVLDLDPDSPEDDGEMYCDEASPWCSVSATGSDLSTFNCCTFAVGDVVGLTPADWINPVSTGNTDDSNPMLILLDSYFIRVKAYAGPDLNWDAIENDDQLQENDVLCYVQTGEKAIEFVHAGKICKNKGHNWLVSKFGLGPLVKAPLRSAGSFFSGHFDVVWVYRSS